MSLGGRAYKGKALEGQKPERLADLLNRFEVAVLEHRLEKLPEYKAELRKTVDEVRERILTMYHRRKLNGGCPHRCRTCEEKEGR